MMSEVGLDKHFATVICAARKPSGTGILRALSYIGVDADEKAFYVGDLTTDAQAAAVPDFPLPGRLMVYGKEHPLETEITLGTISNIRNLL